MNLVAASLLSANFLRLEEDVARIERAGADWLHIDIMDGHFVPNLSMGPMIVEALRGHTGLTLDVHLMVERPEPFIEAFAEAGAQYLTVHQEATYHVHRAVARIKECGCKAGVALNPMTPLDAVDLLLPDLDLLLLMTVNPGFGGQSMIPATVGKVADARRRLDALGSGAALQVDGGVNARTAGELARAGARVLVAGSAVFLSDVPEAVIAAIKMAG